MRAITDRDITALVRAVHVRERRIASGELVVKQRNIDTTTERLQPR